MTKVIFQIGFLAPHCVSATKALHSTGSFFCFSHYFVPINSLVTFFSVFKSNTNQNSSPRSDEGLTLKTSALETF